jgi:CubicO group peptidase (beta-lactamase class C family)
MTFRAAAWLATLLLLAACTSNPPNKSTEAPPAQVLAADTPSTTAAGHGFVAPKDWSIARRGAATVLTPPEGGGSYVALVDVKAADAQAAVAAAWAALGVVQQRALNATVPRPQRDGWIDQTLFAYVTSPNEKRAVSAGARRVAQADPTSWNVSIFDLADDVAGKRGAQLGTVMGRLLPQGRQRESFAGKTARPLDAARLAELVRHVEEAARAGGVPGVSFGVVQGGRVVSSTGVGVRELGKPERPDGDTKYMIASNTKGLATLMLAKLVDQGRIGWDMPAAQLLPSFKLGDAATTRQVLVKHLICACTGMPRQDLEWLLEFQNLTPEGAMALLDTMKPTSGFGQLFQYSNPMAAAAGYIGGHVAFPQLALGPAYDEAMRTLVFEPLGMKDTTHDFARAVQGNVATPHAPDVQGRMALAEARTNLSIVPVRPAGGAWSTVNDMLRYVQMELAEGALPSGQRYIGRDALLARRAPQVAVGTDSTYGMGLFVNRTHDVTVVHHGGDMIGFHSDMMWLPEHGVGAVVLTNADPGWFLRSVFQRKLLELLFDGKPEADERVAVQSKAWYAELAAERKRYTVPADPAAAALLATRYSHPAVGGVAVKRVGNTLRFDFGEWDSEMATRTNPDGTTSFITIVPGFTGLELVAGAGTGANAGKRTLTLRDAQHQYVLVEQ